jgi:hypothetical protein
MHYSGNSSVINNDMDKDNAINVGGEIYHSDTHPSHLMKEVRFDDHKDRTLGSSHYRPVYKDHKVFARPCTQNGVELTYAPADVK